MHPYINGSFWHWLWLLLLSLFFGQADAAEPPVSLSFSGIPVVQFAQVTYKDILGKDYLVVPELVGNDARISLHVRSIDKEKLPVLLAEVLRSAGIRATEVAGVVRLERIPEVSSSAASAVPLAAETALDLPKDAGLPKPPDPEDFEVYRPQNRTADYLRAAMGFAASAGPSASLAGLSGKPGASLPQAAAAGQPLDVVVLSGTEAKRERLRRLLADLDRKPEVVNVRAALIEFVDTKDDTFNVSGVLSLLGQRLQLALSPGQTFTNYARLRTGGIDAVVGALAGDSRFRFRTTPSLRLVDGERGRLQVGSDVPVRGDATVTQGGQTVVSTVYRSSGLVLTIVPRVMANRIQAVFSQEVSSFQQTTTSNIDSPTLNKRMIEATIDAEDGEVVVLAGLDESNESDGKSGPFRFMQWNSAASSRTTQILVLLEFRKV